MTTLTIEQDTFKPFFQLSKEAIKLLWGTKLSGNDWKVFSFLSLIDPFGDRWCEIPNIDSICQLLEMSHASFYRAIAKLKNQGIIKAEIKGFMFQNILGFAKMRGEVEKNFKPFTKMQEEIEESFKPSTKLQKELEENFKPSIKFSKELSIKLWNAKLSKNDWKVFSCLLIIDPSNVPEYQQIADYLEISMASFYRTIIKLHEGKLLPKYVNYNPKLSLEQQITNRLHEELGGLKEISTPIGKIDLLTDTEIIEVKEKSDWKSALGQVLTYSAYYPEHKKRIHLFGESLDNLELIQNSCLAFNVIVTAEVLQGGESNV